LWQEVQNLELDTQGRYVTLLGAGSREGLPIEMFASGEPRWLGVRAQLPDEAEQPRILLLSVPYALKAADAETLGGKPLSAFVLAPEVVTARVLAGNSGDLPRASATAGPPSPAVAGTGTLNKLVKWLETGGLGTLG